MTVRDLLNVVPLNTPVEIGGINKSGPFTIRPSWFREDTMTRLGLIDRDVILLRLDKQKEETVLRIVVLKEEDSDEETV